MLPTIPKRNYHHLTIHQTNQIPHRPYRTHLHLSSTSLSRLSLTCALKRSARLTLARHRLSLSFLTLCIASYFYIRSLIRTARSDTARIPSLVATTLDRLATQAALHTRGDAAESWISVGQLRDDILRDEFSDKRRESLWKRVSAVVEKNANVRASVRESRTGDISKVWEWIGSVGLLDESWSDRRSGGGEGEKELVSGVWWMRVRRRRGKGWDAEWSGEGND